MPFGRCIVLDRGSWPTGKFHASTSHLKSATTNWKVQLEMPPVLCCHLVHANKLLWLLLNLFWYWNSENEQFCARYNTAGPTLTQHVSLCRCVISIESCAQVKLCQGSWEDTAAKDWAPSGTATDAWTAWTGLRHKSSYMGIFSYDTVTTIQSLFCHISGFSSFSAFSDSCFLVALQIFGYYCYCCCYYSLPSNVKFTTICSSTFAHLRFAKILL